MTPPQIFFKLDHFNICRLARSSLTKLKKNLIKIVKLEKVIRINSQKQFKLD